ncbi:MAG: WecB/TagA/CpsF family glycosyltransferase [Candidatus Schekmanbacteria bacterium]|nr:WecB/TagA/CpsF family glycosyltransferase [Candidatus Schekmanbacteria bacterium]
MSSEFFQMLARRLVASSVPVPTAGLYSFLNPHSYSVLRNEPEIIRSLDGVFVDGLGASLLLSAICLRRIHRVSFDSTSLAPAIFTQCADLGRSIAFVGGTDGELRAALRVLQDQFPRLAIVLASHGFFRAPVDELTVMQEIVRKQPEVLVVGMGTPLQERFLLKVRDLGWRGLGFSCGGYLCQMAKGSFYYYPKWIDRLQLRFLYRFVCEPHIRRRYLTTYPIAAAEMLKDRFYW